MGVVRALGRPSFERTWSKQGEPTSHLKHRARAGRCLGAMLGAYEPRPSRRPLAALQPLANWVIITSPSRRLYGKADPSSTGEYSRHLPPGRNPWQGLPSKRPALPGPLMGRCLTNKSSQGRADAQRLVATRLLDRLHDPLGHFSRLQRIYPRAR